MSSWFDWDEYFRYTGASFSMEIGRIGVVKNITRDDAPPSVILTRDENSFGYKYFAGRQKINPTGTKWTKLDASNETIEKQLGYINSKGGFSYVTEEEFKELIKDESF